MSLLRKFFGVQRRDYGAMSSVGQDSGDGLMHQCLAMPQQGVEIRRDTELGDADPRDWVLSVYREAGESDLEENHYLEEAGQVLWNTVLVIRYCPFCGEQLSGDSGRSAFRAWHFDYADLGVKER